MVRARVEALTRQALPGSRRQAPLFRPGGKVHVELPATRGAQAIPSASQRRALTAMTTDAPPSLQSARLRDARIAGRSRLRWRAGSVPIVSVDQVPADGRGHDVLQRRQIDVVGFPRIEQIAHGERGVIASRRKRTGRLPLYDVLLRERIKHAAPFQWSICELQGPLVISFEALYC